ncbi:MAG: HIT family protein [Acidiferrobacteraceae bacterium]
MITNKHCPLCTSDGGEVLLRDGGCRVVVAEELGQPAMLRVILGEHVAEMTDLPAAQRDHVMALVFAAESAVRTVLQPDKINLASLGNYVPHLHWHVIPRFRDDAQFPDPVWSPARREARARLMDVDRLRQVLTTHGSGKKP